MSDSSKKPTFHGGFEENVCSILITRSSCAFTGTSGLEKVHDQFKNKLHEKKSWASNATAKTDQAVFLCLVHNLMVCYQATLARVGVRNTAGEKRRKKVLTDCAAKVEKARRQTLLIVSGFQRFTQHTVKFILKTEVEWRGIAQNLQN
jgi:hypothetical protein